MKRVGEILFVQPYKRKAFQVNIKLVNNSDSLTQNIQNSLIPFSSKSFVNQNIFVNIVLLTSRSMC